MTSIVDVKEVSEDFCLERYQLSTPLDEEKLIILQLHPECLFCIQIKENFTSTNMKPLSKHLNLLSKKQLSLAVRVNSKILLSQISQVACVGCRRSCERLFNEIKEFESKSLEPLSIDSNGDLTVDAKYLNSQAICNLFAKHSAPLNEILDTIPKVKKSGRCMLHSMDGVKCPPDSQIWAKLWHKLSTKCKNALTVLDCKKLQEALDEYLRKHRFCLECKNKVQKAFDILIGKRKVDKENDKHFSAALYSGISVCFKGHVHVNGDAEFIMQLLTRAEPEMLGRRERHAKTLEVAQEEVVTCIGLFLYERFYRLYIGMKEEVQAFHILFHVGLDALKRNLQIAVDEKRGFSNLEKFCEEIQNQEKKSKKIKKNKKKNENKEKKVTVDLKNDKVITKHSPVKERSKIEVVTKSIDEKIDLNDHALSSDSETDDTWQLVCKNNNKNKTKKINEKTDKENHKNQIRKGKTPEELRVHFNIRNDFTPEEGEAILEKEMIGVNRKVKKEKKEKVIPKLMARPFSQHNSPTRLLTEHMSRENRSKTERRLRQNRSCDNRLLLGKPFSHSQDKNLFLGKPNSPKKNLIERRAPENSSPPPLLKKSFSEDSLTSSCSSQCSGDGGYCSAQCSVPSSSNSDVACSEAYCSAKWGEAKSHCISKCSDEFCVVKCSEGFCTAKCNKNCIEKSSDTYCSTSHFDCKGLNNTVGDHSESYFREDASSGKNKLDADWKTLLEVSDLEVPTTDTSFYHPTQNDIRGKMESTDENTCQNVSFCESQAGKSFGSEMVSCTKENKDNCELNLNLLEQVNVSFERKDDFSEQVGYCSEEKGAHSKRNHDISGFSDYGIRSENNFNSPILCSHKLSLGNVSKEFDSEFNSNCLVDNHSNPYDNCKKILLNCDSTLNHLDVREGEHIMDHTPETCYSSTMCSDVSCYSSTMCTCSDVSSGYSSTICSDAFSDSSTICSDVFSDSPTICSDVSSDSPTICSNVSSDSSTICSDVSSDSEHSNRGKFTFSFYHSPKQNEIDKLAINFLTLPFFPTLLPTPWKNQNENSNFKEELCNNEEFSNTFPVSKSKKDCQQCISLTQMLHDDDFSICDNCSDEILELKRAWKSRLEPIKRHRAELRLKLLQKFNIFRNQMKQMATPTV